VWSRESSKNQARIKIVTEHAKNFWVMDGYPCSISQSPKHTPLWVLVAIGIYPGQPQLHRNIIVLHFTGYKNTRRGQSYCKGTALLLFPSLSCIQDRRYPRYWGSLVFTYFFFPFLFFFFLVFFFFKTFFLKIGVC